MSFHLLILYSPTPIPRTKQGYFLWYTTLPPNESAQDRSVYTDMPTGFVDAPPKGLQGFRRKVESWLRFVGLNGLLWNIVRLNQPNANLMPISQKHRASHVNSTNDPKLPQITQKISLFPLLGLSRSRQHLHRIASNAPESPAYMTHVTRAYAIPHNARCTTHITRPNVTLHNPCGTNLYHLHKALDSSCYGLGSDLN